MEVEAQRRRSNSTSSSPEFEFWMVRNPSLPSQHLLAADELIVDGVLLPLHLLSLQRPSPPLHPRAALPTSSIISSTPTSSSRRWKDLFKPVGEGKAEDKERRKEQYINLIKIWPFSRSRSSGNTATRPRSASRKISSAPCSRSNSRGESPGGRRWAASPGRTGRVHLGRSSPVWQFRRSGVGLKEKVRKYGPAPVATGGGIRVLNLSVNSCIGYQNAVSCRDDESDGLTGSAGAAGRNGDNGAFFSFRALFSKKVY